MKLASEAPDGSKPAVATTIVPRGLGSQDTVPSNDTTRTSDESRADSAFSQPLPQRLVAPLQIRDPDRYDVLGEHGRGGLGKVARARDKELGRYVAIKELLKRGDLGEVRFLREALITARLEHPGIVPIHEAGRWPDGTPFYVMKLVAGRSLKELLAERKTVNQRVGLLHHVIAVADAVAYAHKKKIIHRDLKPANVIVGDFGETIVIDWGLAKDLSQPEGPMVEARGGQTAALTDLTETGTVLGTPTYMPPEQWRGEAVDERADVFAIGAMLWEVCSTSQVPPADPRHRDRLLRRAGIDQDLCTILIKALSPEPERRYHDAGELAADLKAFTSGSRIASRRYSLVGVLRHWTRRHRALAITITAGVLLAAVVAIVAVLNIASARGRAEIEQRRAETEQRRAEKANAELVLENAEVLMTRDPTAVVTALANYRGPNTLRRQRLLAEARGRGVAESVSSPHSDTVVFVAGDASGAVFTLSRDYRIRVTEHGVSTTLANDIAPALIYCYCPERQLIAYTTVRGEVAILDLKRRTRTTLPTNNVEMMAFSPQGSRIAIGTKGGSLSVWAVGGNHAMIYRETHSPEIWSLLFSGEERIVLSGPGWLHSVSLNGGSGFVAPAHGTHVADVSNANVLVSDLKGGVALLSSELLVMARAAPCRGTLPYVRFAPIVKAVAYACSEGSVGLLEYDELSHSLSTKEVFPTVGSVVQFDVDASGRWVLAATKLNALLVYDSITKLRSKYEGHGARIRAVAAPAKMQNFVLTGDVNGAVRRWRLPADNARKIYQGRHGLTDVAATIEGREVVVGSFDGVVRRVAIANGQVTEFAGHSRSVYNVGATVHGLHSTSEDGTVRTWVGSLSRVFSEHGAVAEAAYHAFLEKMVSVGADGKMFSWPMVGHEKTLLFSHDVPLAALELLSNSGHIITHDRRGSVWDVAPQGVSKRVRMAGSVPVALIKASPSGRYLAVVTADFAVTIYETSSWGVILSMRVGGNVRQIAFDPQDRDLLIASEDGLLRAVPLERKRIFWREFPARIRDVVYHPDGSLIAFVCSDGSAWFHDIAKGMWKYARHHEEDTLSAVFSRDGKNFVSVDVAGGIIVRSMSSGIGDE